MEWIGIFSRKLLLNDSPHCEWVDGSFIDDNVAYSLRLYLITHCHLSCWASNDSAVKSKRKKVSLYKGHREIHICLVQTSATIQVNLLQKRYDTIYRSHNIRLIYTAGTSIMHNAHVCSLGIVCRIKGLHLWKIMKSTIWYTWYYFFHGCNHTLIWFPIHVISCCSSAHRCMYISTLVDSNGLKCSIFLKCWIATNYVYQKEDSLGRRPRARCIHFFYSSLSPCS